jgi:hypothetical protein
LLERGRPYGQPAARQDSFVLAGATLVQEATSEAIIFKPEMSRRSGEER